MASTYEGQVITEQHRLAQARIAREVVRELRIVWPMLDPQRLDATAPGWSARVLQILTENHGLSAATSLEYLEAFRIAETGRTVQAVSGIVTVLAPAAAVSVAVTGPVAIKQAVKAGASSPKASSAAFTQLASAGIMHVLNGGRDTIATAVRRDRRARGWQRVTAGAPCYFCAMLASRGPVYRKNSFRREQVHGKCGCTSEPVYDSETNWVGDAGRWNDLWYASTKGTGGDEAVRRFRSAYNLTTGGTQSSRSPSAARAVKKISAPKLTLDTSLIDQAKKLDQQAQAAFRAGDDAKRIRLQAEASAIRRDAYNRIGEGLDNKAA